MRGLEPPTEWAILAGERAPRLGLLPRGQVVRVGRVVIVWRGLGRLGRRDQLAMPTTKRVIVKLHVFPAVVVIVEINV